MFTGTARYITHKDAEMQYAKKSKPGDSSQLCWLLALGIHRHEEGPHLVVMCCYYTWKAECSVHTQSDLIVFKRV